jgi:hypothetical protein
MGHFFCKYFSKFACIEQMEQYIVRRLAQVMPALAENDERVAWSACILGGSAVEPGNPGRKGERKLALSLFMQ